LALLSCGVFRNRSMMGEPLFIKEQSTSFQKVQFFNAHHLFPTATSRQIVSPLLQSDLRSTKSACNRSLDDATIRIASSQFSHLDKRRSIGVRSLKIGTILGVAAMAMVLPMVSDSTLVTHKIVIFVCLVGGLLVGFLFDGNYPRRC
jgi:hypothetical protein